MTSTQPAPEENRRGQDLSLAPVDKRCQAQIEYEDGSLQQCSRFTIRPPGGDREDFCIGHSHSGFARLLRSKGSKGQRALQEAEADRLADLAHELFPRVWRKPRELLVGRWRLSRAIVRGDVSVAQANLLRSLIQDASKHMQTGQNDWA